MHNSRPWRRVLKQTWPGILILLGLLLAAGWMLTRDPIDRDRVYRIGYGGDVPMHFAGPDGTPDGVAVEIVRAAAARRGIRLEWLSARDPSVPELDLWVLKSLRPDETTPFYYTAPYLQAESCFLVRADSPVRDLPDLAGARISYIDYAIHRSTLPKLLPHFIARPVASSEAAVTAMLAGEADAAYIDQYTLFTTLLNGEHTALRILPTRSPTRQMALAARPEMAAVADEIRSGMQQLVTDGTLAAIMRRWIFFPNFTADIIGDSAEKYRQLRWMATGLGVLTVLLLVTIGFSLLARRRKEQWRRSERKYRELHESMTDAFARFDLDGRILETNPVFDDLLGYPAAELLGRNAADLTPPAWRDEDRRIVHDQVLGRGFSDVHEKEFLHRDGRRLPVELRLHLLRDETGRPAGMWAIVRDVSDRKLAESERVHLQQQLAQAQRLEVVGRLAGGVAHDFNNMLQAILGNATLAQMDLPAGSPVRDHIDQIQGAAKRSADLTRQLLTFARKQTVRPRVLDLNATVEGMLKLLRRLIGERIDITWHPGRGLWPVRIDPSQFDQVLTNLCVNARDAIAGTGSITLTTTNRGPEPGTPPGPDGRPVDYIELSITDTGSGMDAGTLAHVFEPFFTTKAMGAGTGLGLATVYGIVTQNGGLIQAASEPGRGAAFRILFPRVDTPVEAEGDDTPPTNQAARGSETILLVEDEDSILRVTEIMLGKLGYRVLTAPSPRRAFEVSQQHPGRIDLLITDVIMPEMHGRDLAARLQEERPGLRCLFISGYDPNVVAPEGELPAGVQFLGKPFSTGDLARKVREAMDSSAPAG